MKTVSSGRRYPVLKLQHGGSAVMHIVRCRVVEVRGEPRTVFEGDLALGKGDSTPVCFWPSKGLAAALAPYIAGSPVVRISRSAVGGNFASYTADVAEGPDEQKTLFLEPPKGHELLKRS